MIGLYGGGGGGGGGVVFVGGGGGGGGGGGEEGYFMLRGGRNAICDLKTQALIIGGKIVSTIFHHLHGVA